MRKFVAGLLIGVILATATPTFAANAVRIVLNGKEVFPQTPPIIVNGTVMVPLRFIAEQIGIQVSWDNASRTVFLQAKQIPNATVANATPVPSPEEKEKAWMFYEKCRNLIDKAGKMSKNSNSKEELEALSMEIVNTVREIASWKTTTYKNLAQYYSQALIHSMLSLEARIRYLDYSNEIIMVEAATEALKSAHEWLKVGEEIRNLKQQGLM